MEARIDEGGGTAAKRAKLCPVAGAGVGGEGEDRLSALPDDVLLHILGTLGTAAAAARTSVLSRRWRRLWALLPALTFFFDAGHNTVPHALAALDAVHGDDDAPPPLRSLLVVVSRASADSLQAWLPIAARRLAGDLSFFEMPPPPPRKQEEGDEATRGGGAFELPCFEKATQIWLILKLGFHSLAMPPSGVFARLTDFHLEGVRLHHGPCRLGEAASSPRCPSLQKLTLSNVEGLGDFAIRSQSLLELELKGCHLQQLAVTAPALQKLTVSRCFDFTSQPVADIAAPQLVSLEWRDAYDPMAVKFGEMEHLEGLATPFLLAYGPPGFAHNRHCLRLLRHIEAVRTLNLVIVLLACIFEGMDHPHYLMEEMERLPDIRSLNLFLFPNGHSIGASSFHVLRMRTGIRKLGLVFDSSKDVEVATTCASGCICDEPINWKTEELVLWRLQDIDIHFLLGTEHEFALVERLFNWATVLKTVTISFHHSIAESMANKFCQRILGFSRPEICVKFYVFRGFCQKLLYVPVD